MDNLAFLISLVVFLSCIFGLECGEKASLGRGFNDDLDWHGMEDGLAAAKDSGKPMMVLIHKSWCGACKKLKPVFAESKEIEQLSSRFVLVNIEDKEEDDIGNGFSPDGSYIPRIFFTDSEGKVQEDVYNELGSDKYKYFYSFPTQITQSMKKAIKQLAAGKAENSEL